jgi:Fanconi anemia group J protein
LVDIILDPLIRKKLNIDLNGSVIILDEAHNIEDVAKDCAGFLVNMNDLRDTSEEIKELSYLKTKFSESYVTLSNDFHGLIAWFEDLFKKIKQGTENTVSITPINILSY